MLAVAVALCAGMLKKISAGTMALPPAIPAKPAMRPAIAPIKELPKYPGKVRFGSGFQFVSIMMEINPIKMPKNQRKIPGGRFGAMYPAEKLPTRRKGRSLQTMFQLTLCALIWVKAAEAEVKTIQDRDVAIATSIATSGEYSPVKVYKKYSIGTMTTPPPIPSRPPRKPLNKPKAKHKEMKK